MRYATTIAMLLAASFVSVVAEPVEEPVRHGDRLDISNYAGTIHIATWEHDSLRVTAQHRAQDTVRVVRRGSVLRVRTQSWDEPSDSLAIYDDERAVLRLDGKDALPGVVDYTVTVPVWLPVMVGGATTDVSIDGLHASAEITLFQGEVQVRELRGDLSIRSLGGQVTVEETEGSVKIRGWQGNVALRGMRGDVTVETTSGGIDIRDHAGGGIDVLTVAGSIMLESALPETGAVSLASHSGDLTLALPTDVDASVAVRRVRGEFETDFPVDSPRKKSFRFQLGSGRTVVDLESFSGAIRLTREGP